MKVIQDHNVIRFPNPGIGIGPLVTPAPEPPKVMTSTAEADIRRHESTLRAFKDAQVSGPAAVAILTRAARALGFLIGFSAVVLVASLLAFTVGYLIGGMR